MRENRGKAKVPQRSVTRYTTARAEVARRVSKEQRPLIHSVADATHRHAEQTREYQNATLSSGRDPGGS
jgi:hypothetical protein